MVHERLKKITQCEPWLSTEPCTNHTNWIERLRSRCHAGSPAAILGILNPEKKKYHLDSFSCTYPVMGSVVTITQLLHSSVISQ